MTLGCVGHPEGRYHPTRPSNLGYPFWAAAASRGPLLICGAAEDCGLLRVAGPGAQPTANHTTSLTHPSTNAQQQPPLRTAGASRELSPPCARARSPHQWPRRKTVLRQASLSSLLALQTWGSSLSQGMG